MSEESALRRDVVPRAGSNWLIGTVLAALLALLLAAVVVNLILTLSRTSAGCSFYKDLSGLPVTVVATTGKPSELGVGIIAHSREAFRGSGCTGTLPPPSASFRRWAPFFGLDPS